VDTVETGDTVEGGADTTAAETDGAAE